MTEIPKETFFEALVEDRRATNHDDSAFELEWIDDETLRLKGGKLERLAKVTDIEDRPAMHRLMNIYTAMGVFKRLEKENVPPGTTVFVGRLELVYEPDTIEADLVAGDANLIFEN